MQNTGDDDLVHSSHSSSILTTSSPPSIQLKKVKIDNEFTKSLSHLVAGATGGVTTALLTCPLDVLRTRLQSDFYRPWLSRKPSFRPDQPRVPNLFRSTSLHLRETFQILFSIYTAEGWRGLFRGLGPNLLGVVPASAIKFYTYGNCKRLIAESQILHKDSVWGHIASAATAGIVTSTVTSPIWLIKTRLQLDRSLAENANVSAGSTTTAAAATTKRYKNSLDCVAQVLRQEGIRGMYRGLSASYLGALETTFHLALYEQMKLAIATPQTQGSVNTKTLGNRVQEWASMGGAAGLAKLVAGLIAYPHEVIRTRLRQAPMANGLLKYTGVIQCFRLICREEGLRSMYGGLTPHLLRSIPSAAITLGVYEAVLGAFETFG